MTSRIIDIRRFCPTMEPTVSIVCLTVLSYAGSSLVSGQYFTENTLQLSCKDCLGTYTVGNT